MDDGTKKVLKWVGFGCGGAALLAGCLVTVCFYGFAGAISGPADAAHEMLESIRGNDTASAYAHMSPAYRATHPLPVFQTSVAQIPTLTTHTDATFSQRNVSNNTGTASGHLTTPQGNVAVQISGHNEAGTWFIDSLTVAGQSIQ